MTVAVQISHSPLLSMSSSSGWSFLETFDDRYNFLSSKAVYLGLLDSVQAFKEVMLIRGLNVYEPVGNIIKSLLLIYTRGFEDTRTLRIASLCFHFVNSMLIYVYSYILIFPSSETEVCYDNINERGKAAAVKNKDIKSASTDFDVDNGGDNDPGETCRGDVYCRRNKPFLICSMMVYALFFLVHPLNVQVILSKLFLNFFFTFYIFLC